MTRHSTTPADETTLFLEDGWSDPLEAGIRDRIRDFIEELIEEELAAALGRGRYEHRRHGGDTPAVDASEAAPLSGHRHGHRERQLIGSFGPVEITVPRARVGTADGRTDEWKSKVLPRYARMTRQVEALIAVVSWKWLEFEGGVISLRVVLDPRPSLERREEITP